MLLLLFACHSQESQEKPTNAFAFNTPLLSISPETPTPNDTLHCEATTTSEGVAFKYTWFSNTSGMRLQTNQLRPSQTAWGDTWTCIATPFTEEHLGQPHSISIEFPNDCSTQIEYDGDITLSPNSPPLNFCRYYNHISGNLWIQDASKLEEFDCLCEVNGNVIITSSSPPSSSSDLFPYLQIIQGDFILLEDDHISQLNFPNLEDIKGNVQILRSSIQNISAPNLSSIANSLSISENDVLDLVFFPSLKQIGGDFTINKNDALAYITNNVDSIGGTLIIQENETLNSLSASCL